ncbi:hypothetical protein GS884_07855 [Rhodococcus hoagii]|nr:hypothetical protein [Prescottella equi]
MAHLLLDVAAPTNNPVTNPEVLTRAIADGRQEPGPRNVVPGRGRGQARWAAKRTDDSAFTVGENMAATPGRVVFRKRSDRAHPVRNQQTEKVHATPLLACPPGSHKFYIMDIGPGRSFGRVGDPARPHRLPHLVPQPGRVDERGGFRRLPHRRVARRRWTPSRRSPGRRSRLVGLCLGGAMASIAAAT